MDGYTDPGASKKVPTDKLSIMCIDDLHIGSISSNNINKVLWYKFS